ncbi:helix-turn-helix transcriptional regulator [Novosphingobium colocasiae]|uniref:DNA-binding protein n=1 Tax=Novosphingobium colocasiae TaxID=1256513 RepID=A0A918PCH7_9SPHN|nr:LuxR C-terminal-related transcriptional regulator [Novosphingobium colocasiae]GGY97944.1 DNA-binding protein [Novosphingobium colocasiae]
MIDRIYEAAVLPDGWSGVLEDIGRGVGAKGGLLIARSEDGARFAGSPEALAVAQDFVAAGHMEHNDRVPRLIARQHPGFETDLDFHTLDEMARLPMYADFLVPRGWPLAAATSLRSSGENHLVLTIEGFTKVPELLGSVEHLDALRPHLARSAIMAAQLRLEQARGMIAALDIVGLPAAALNGRRMMAANALLQTRLEAGALAMAGGLRLSDPQLDQMLQAALDAAGGHDGQGTSIALPGDGGHCRDVVHVLPLRGDARDIFSGITALVIFASVDKRPAIPADMLQSLFGLTAAEASIVQGLAAGQSVASLSEQAGKSAHTVKTQVKSVLAKVGVNRQADLIRTIADLCIRRPPGADDRAA